jgi:hypothetical protein
LEAKELIRIDFDNMENRDALYETSLGTFVQSDELTAHGVLLKWLSEQPPVNMYLGWDGEVYPKFKVKTHILIQ